ncbi:MAG: DinB family protein [Nitrospinae bacterium]|nr:DinB family protein [Nitrospinota bacterium]
MEEVIEFAVGLMERNWSDIKNALKDVTDDELDWRPVPESNNIKSIVRHLRTVGQLYLSLLEDGDQTPWRDEEYVQKLTDSIAYDFQDNMKALEEFHNRFVSLMNRGTVASLKAQTFVESSSSRPQSKDSLLHREIRHLVTHTGQIRTLRNLYRRTKGEKGLFFPDNRTFRD